jgi:prevent-host-death family protein
MPRAKATKVGVPRTLAIRDLSRHTGDVIRVLRAARRPAIVTDRGRPVALIIPTDPDQMEEFVIANAPEFIRSLALADAEFAAGLARPASEVFAELDLSDEDERSADGRAEH